MSCAMMDALIDSNPLYTFNLLSYQLDSSPQPTTIDYEYLILQIEQLRRVRPITKHGHTQLIYAE
jgi:hypothetical protein